MKCEHCGKTLPTNRRSDLRYCPKPKNCKQLAYVKRVHELARWAKAQGAVV